MDRAGAAEGHQAELPRVVAALHRDDAERLAHVGVDHLDDARGGLRDAEAERRRDVLGDRALGGGAAYRQAAVEQRGAVEVAEHDVRVRHGRAGAAAAVGGGAGRGAGAVRPDLERAAGVDPGDAAAAGADLREVDHRHADRVAGAGDPALGVAGAADLVLRRHRDLAADDHAGLGRGAAHVEGQHVGQAESGGRPAPPRPRRRPGRTRPPRPACAGTPPRRARRRCCP